MSTRWMKRRSRAPFARKPPRFLHPGIILFPNSPAHLLVSWRILIWNLETREEEIRKAEAEAAFERKRKLYTTKQAH